MLAGTVTQRVFWDRDSAGLPSSVLQLILDICAPELEGEWRKKKRSILRRLSRRLKLTTTDGTSAVLELRKADSHVQAPRVLSHLP